MKSLNRLEKLDAAMQDFLVPLRMGRGFDAAKFEVVCNMIKNLNLEWKQQQGIPKAAAILFLDAHSAMMSCSDLYPSQASRILAEADVMHALIRECCE